MRKLAFYLDFISPYAYLAWTQIHALASKHGCEVVPRPVLFAALLDANGQKGPAEIPRKRVYTFKDVVRSARRLDVPIAAPASHPFNPLLALRVASADMSTETRKRLVDALFAATWAKGAGITVPANVAAIATEAGADGARLVDWAGSLEAKERVKRSTAEALDLGAFGVPTMVVDGELFWGLDSMPNLERFLEGKDPLAGLPKTAWTEVAPSATRAGAGASAGASAGPSAHAGASTGAPAGASPGAGADATALSATEGPLRSTRDIILRTEQFDAAVGFYEKTLGFRPTLRESNLVGFETGAFQLFVEKGPSQPPVFEVLVDDFRSAKAALLAAGCRVVEENPSLPRCYLVDPYGFVFNLGS